MIVRMRNVAVNWGVVVAAGLAAFPLASSAVSAAVVVTPPVVVYSAALGNTLTDGLNSSSSPNNLTEQGTGVIAGYDTVTGVNRSLYYLVPSTNSFSLVFLNDGLHLQTTSTPVFGMVSPDGTLLGSQSRSGDGTHNDGTDVFYSVGGAAPNVVPLPTGVLGSNASYSFTDTNDGYPSQIMTFSAPTDGAAAFSTNLIQSGGIIVGTVTRYAGNSYTANPGSSLGTDGFYYNPAGAGSSTAMGLTGAQYEFTPAAVTNTTLKDHTTTVTGLANGAAFGFTQRFDGTSAGVSLGFDSWIYTPSGGTTQVGLVGGAYTVVSGGNTYQESETFRTNTLGQVAGKSFQPSSTGALLGITNYAWLYTPSLTPGTASGFGTTSAGTYAQLGNTTAATATTLGYFNTLSGSNLHANTNIAFLTNNGTATGAQNRYDINGTSQGLAAWYYNGSSNSDISPSPTGVHAAVTGGATASSNTLTAMQSRSNGSDMIGGYATRIAGTTSGAASLGQDAWVYDTGNSTSYWVDPTDEAMGTGNYELSYVGLISSNGEAVGYYNTYSGTSSTVLSSNLFVWNESNGIQVLATYAGSSASSSMANYVSSFNFDAQGDLFGPNTYTNATSIVEYTAVPEPTTLGLIGVGAIALLDRWRRSA